MIIVENMIFYDICKTLFNYRLTNGTAAGIANTPLKTMHLNNYHYSKDPWYSRHMSYIVPKGSPLKVVRKKL